MTIVAGLVGPGSAKRACLAIIAAQSAYSSSAPSLKTGDGFALAASGPNDKSTSIASARNRWLAIADMRLDNRDEIAVRIGKAVEVGASSDLDVVLELWCRHGAASLDQLLGDYALAIYDCQTRTLAMARDPTGQAPLFFRHHGPRLALASMPMALRPLLGDCTLNARQLAALLANRENAGSETFVDGVERVRPGELVEFREGSLARRTHWKPALYPSAQLPTMDLVDKYRELLDAAVAARIKGETTLGSHLSSGFDSSAVTATAARLIGPESRLTSFTSAPLASTAADPMRHWCADEAALAAETAGMHGLRHVVVRETDQWLNVVRRQSALVQAPLWDAFNTCWWSEIRKRASRQGVTTILTGEAGNLTINAGGLGTLATYVRAGKWRDWWREARLVKAGASVRWRGIALNSFGALLPDAAWTAARRHFRGIPPASEASFLRPHWRDVVGVHGPAKRPSGDPYADRLTALRLGDLGPYRQAALGDRQVRESDPTSDRRLIEFSLMLPPEALLRDGISRPLARAALADRLPQSILNASLRGMQGTDWHHRLGQEDARQILAEISPIPLVQDLLDLPRMHAAIDHWPQSDFNNFRNIAIYRNALGSALATGIFIQLFDRQKPD